MTRINIELAIVCSFLVTALLLLNPFGVIMSESIYMTVLTAFTVTSGAFIAIFAQENAGDEREHIHRSLAGQAAFTVGTVCLLIGILVQSSTGTVDPWLIYTLCAMVMAKLAVRVYCAYRN